MRGFITLALVLVTATSCATRQEIVGREVQGVDRKLSTFAYIEEGNLVTFVVDTRIARGTIGDPRP